MPPAGKYATTPAYYPQGTAPVPIPEEEAGPPPQPAYVPESSASYQYAAPPPQPEYVATDMGYDAAYPGPPPQPEYIPTTQSAPPAPLPQSPSMAGPAAPPPPSQQYGMPAPTGNDIVTSTYPATGTTTVMTKDGAVQPYYPIQVEQTYRTIPPAGSTYPSAEIAYGLPPRNNVRLQKQYRQGNYPDLEPRFPGDGPLGQGPPISSNTRQVPSETYAQLHRPWWRGEGDMGARDPLSPYNESGQRPKGRYVWGMGETRPEDIWRPGWGSPFSDDTLAHAQADPANAGHVPPPGYVPEIWDGRGDHMSSYWLEKASAPEEVQPHGAGYAGDLTSDQYRHQPPPAVPSSYANADTLTAMERRRRERRLRGLFGGG